MEAYSGLFATRKREGVSLATKKLSDNNFITARVANSRYPSNVLIQPGYSNNVPLKESVAPLHLAL